MFYNFFFTNKIHKYDRQNKNDSWNKLKINTILNDSQLRLNDEAHSYYKHPLQQQQQQRNLNILLRQVMCNSY